MTNPRVVTGDEKIACLRLVHDEYVRAGLMMPNELGIRTNKFLESAKTIGIYGGDSRPLATVSIVRDSAVDGLPVDSILTGLESSLLRFLGEGRLVEIAALAIAQNARELKWRLFCALFDHIKDMVAVIEVHPTHKNLYRRLTFEQLTTIARPVESVEGSPGVVMWKRMNTFKADLKTMSPQVYALMFE